MVKYLYENAPEVILESLKLKFPEGANLLLGHVITHMDEGIAALYFT